MQTAKGMPAVLVPNIRILVQVPKNSVLVQFPFLCLGMQPNEGSGSWGSALHVGDPDGALAFSLGPG